MKKRNIPMSFQIMFFCQALILVISITITVVFYLDIRSITENDFKERSTITMRYLNANLNGVIKSFTDIVENTGAIFNSLPDYDVAEAVLQQFENNIPDILSMYYGTVVSRHAVDGYYIDSSGWEPEYEWDPPNRPWHQAAIANPDRTMIVDPYVDADTDELVITVCRAVKDKNGRITGVIAIDVLLGRLTEIVFAEKITDDGDTLLIDNGGIYVVHRDMDKITEDSIFDDMPELIRGNILSGEITVELKSNKYVASAPLEGTDWFMVSYGSLSAINNEIGRLLKTVIIVMIVMMIISAVVLFILTRRLVKPLRNVVKTLEEISKTWNLTLRLDPDHTGGTTEIAFITEIFNNTFDSIKDLIINIREEADILSSIGNDLASNMNETAAAVNEITANVQSIKGRIINQSASVSETHATMEQVVININKLNGHVGNQSNNISQASASIEEMVANIASVTKTLIDNAQNVNTLVQASEVGRNGLQDVVTDINEIARESEGLLQINSVMENIASQTNLLSMNAAIEAAHAGEAGRGFAVVAAEIRKLAESSSEQSKTIGMVLKKMKESVDKISSSTGKVIKNFEAIDSSLNVVTQQEENIRNAMEEQGQGSQQVLEGISNVNTITRQVQTGSHEMLEGSQEVIKESENLEKATQEITVGMNEMADGAQQINRAVHHVSEISVQNREGIDKLIKEVARFKVV